MEWSEARERTLAKWNGILNGLGHRDVLVLVTEVNEVCELCEKAHSEAGEGEDRCSRCIVFGDSRTCAGARLRISEWLIEGKIDEARAATMAVMAQIAAARPPEAA